MSGALAVEGGGAGWLNPCVGCSRWGVESFEPTRSAYVQPLSVLVGYEASACLCEVRVRVHVNVCLLACLFACGVVRCSAARRGAARCDAMPRGAVQCDAVVWSACVGAGFLARGWVRE